MKYITSAIFAVLFLAQVISSQANAAGVQAEIARQQRADLERRINQDIANRSAAMGNLNRHRELLSRSDAAAIKEIKKLYRLPTEEENALLAPPAGDIQRFADLLKSRRSGLIKLMPDVGCDDLTLQNTRSPDCDRYTIPGGGSGFSFRTGTHRQWLLSDLIFDGRHFIAFGEFSQGFLAHLPDETIETVGLNSEGVKFVSDFVPATLPETVSKQNQEFVEGVQNGRFTYAKLLPAKENGVYVLRSIAYRGKAIRTSLGGIEYNELDFDKRADIIVAFRVIRRAEDGSMTILWKELRRNESPKM